MRGPVVPNASLVFGVLARIRPAPGGDCVWEIDVTEARDVEGLANFVAPYRGKQLAVHVRAGLVSPVRELDVIEARVAFRGDERGGRFVLVGDNVRKQ